MKKHQKVRRADDALVIQKRNSFRRNSPRWRKALAWAVTAWTLGMAPAVYANPVLDAKDAAVAITGTTNMSITSTATNNLIKWVDFSIASGETVAFDANNYLNYVTGHARSDILGTLTGGGHIYLVNPNGILIGDTAVINVGHLHLSTRTLTDAQLAAFTPNGESPLPGTIGGDVINMGQLNANTITVEGNNITFKNTADVTKGGAIGADGKITGGTAHNDSAVTLTANSGGEIHIGSDEGGTLPGYAMSGTDKKYMYKLVNSNADLQNIYADASGNYMLKRSIDMNNYSFVPISLSSTGRFDGLNYSIQNLAVNYVDVDHPSGNPSGVGLFAQNDGVIENLTVVGCNISRTMADPDYSTNANVGIIGVNNGTVRRVSNESGTVSSNANFVGGIVGRNNGTVEQVHNNARVEATGEQRDLEMGFIGGVVGDNVGTIRVAYNTGAVGSDDDESLCSSTGGIAGLNSGTIENVYNAGAVNGFNDVGGIVGYNDGSGAKINYAYNTGDVHKTGQYWGSIAGYNAGGSINNAYGLTGTASMVIGNSDDQPAFKSDGDLKQATTFSGWDISADGSANKIWRIYNGETKPLLTAFMTRKDNYLGELVYDGTKGDVGHNYLTTTQTGAGITQSGINWASDFAIVTPKALTVSFDSPDKVYDGTATATTAVATLDGKVGSDDVSLATGLTAAYGDKNVGANKTVTYSGIALTGAKAGNYSIAATLTATGTISQAPITVSVGDITKTYDGTTNTDNTTDATGGAFTVTSGTLYDGDTISGTKAFVTKDAGTGKTVTLSGVTISDAAGNAGNYTISTVDNTTSTINKAPLTVEFGTTAKNYDGTTTATLPATYTLNGKVDLATENVDIIPENLSIAYADKNAGNGKTVYYEGIALTGTTAGNYALTSTTATGSGWISPIITRASFDPTTKVYDGTTAAPLGAASLTNIIDADLGKVGVTGTAAYDGKDAGDHTVSYSGLLLTGAEAGNYQLASTTGNGTGSITRRPLWLVANPVTITEGEATPTSWSGSVTGFVAGEDLGANDVYFFALDNPAATAAGKYAVTGTLSIDGGNPATSGDYGQNYTFANAASNATAFIIEVKSMTPQEIVLDNVSDPGAAQEYTGTVTAIESDKQETAVLPQVQAANGMPVMAEGRTVVQGAGVNMPKSMSVEALATSLNGGATQQGNAEATTNGPATEPTSTEPASNGESDEEA